ncbi:MAG: hypothetical protein F4Y97_09185 [Dehalococcoidia bacterium]|nr:hypothetical protein [Dehalococcoidia bacterium]
MTGLGRRVRPHPLAFLIGLLALLALAAGSTSASVGASESARGPRLPFQVNASLSPESKEHTAILVQNNSRQAATIVMDFHTPGGVLIPLASEIHTEVPPWGTRTFNQALNQGLLPGFRGVGVLSSDRPLNALLMREAVGTGNARSYAVHNAYADSGVRVALPYVANQLDEDGTVTNTRFSIANAGLDVACVTLTYELVPGRGAASSNGGTTLVSSDVASESCPDGGWVIPAAGQVTLAPEQGTLATAMPSGTVNALMSVMVDSTQPVTVAVDIYGGGNGSSRLASYNGFIVDKDRPGTTEDDISRRVVMPLAQKSVGGYWTEYAIANPWGEAISGSIVYQGTIDGDPGRDVLVTVQIELPAGGGITHSVYDSDELPEGFEGWAMVYADRPVAALLLRANSDDTDSFAAANGVPKGRTTQSAKFPLVFRNVHGWQDQEGTNSWIGIAVADGGKAELEIVAVNNPEAGIKGCEVLALFQTTITIEGSFVFDQGADDKDATGLGALPTCMMGGMVIRSNKPIAAIGGVTSDLQVGDNDALYNAFP